jgi:hypothetical protein
LMFGGSGHPPNQQSGVTIHAIFTELTDILCIDTPLAREK